MAITAKKTERTDMKIKGATIINNIFYDEGEPKDLMAILCGTYEGKVIDISITEKNEQDLDVSSADIE